MLGHGKGMVVPLLIKHYAIKAFGGLEVQLRTFLTAALHEGVWRVLRRCRYTLWKTPLLPIEQNVRKYE
jgi:hypothetical protein